MFDLSGLEVAPTAVALTGAVLGWVLRPLFVHHRRVFVAALAAIAVTAALYGLNSEASSVEETAHPRPAARAFDPGDSDVPPAMERSPTASLREAAQGIARKNGGSFAGEPARLVALALALDASDPVVLDMAANAAFDEHDYPRAIGYWETLATLLPPQSGRQADIDAGIARARLMADARR